MKVAISLRPGNAELSEEDKNTYNTITSFAQITVDKNEEDRSKIKKLKTTDCPE